MGVVPGLSQKSCHNFFAPGAQNNHEHAELLMLEDDEAMVWYRGVRLAQRVAQTRTMQEDFERLRVYPTIGDFLAYQFITDIICSELTSFSEMDFVVPGLGARDGLPKCFVDSAGKEPELIRLIAGQQRSRSWN